MAKRFSDWNEWTNGFTSLFVEWLKDNGWSDHEIRNLLEKDEVVLRRAIEDFANALSYPVKSLKVTIDFREQLIEGLIEDGNYCKVDKRINSARFPAPDRTGVWNIDLYLLSREYLFGKLIRTTTEKVREAMGKRGFVPSGDYFGIYPLLAYGRDYQENNRELELEIVPTLADIGSVCESKRGQAYPQLSPWRRWHKEKCCRLSLRLLERDMHGVNYFAAVRANAV